MLEFEAYERVKALWMVGSLGRCW